jgi:hypothetical protein
MSDTPKIMPVQQCGAVSHCMANPASYERDANRFGSVSSKRTAEFALRKLEEARAVDVENHEKNLPAIEANKSVRETVTAMMVAAGIPDGWSERDLKSRSRYPKSRRVEAGYLADLRKHAVVDDGFSAATATYERLKQEYEKYAAVAETEAERVAEAREKEAERRKAELRSGVERAAIILRYGLSEEAEWDEILDELRKKDQRLDLAVAMQQTRGDWSEGFYRVRYAMERFQIQSTEDKDIANDILSCMDSEDGRVFRDTTWNYGRLFETAADQQLAEDIKKALEKADRE